MSESGRPTLPGGRSAVSGRMVALEQRVATLEGAVHELRIWLVIVGCFVVTGLLLGALYALRRFIA